MGLVTILAALSWLIPGVLGVIALVMVIQTGGVFGQPTPALTGASAGPAIGVQVIVDIAWILIGLKVLLAPGRWSLGCTGLIVILGAILALVLVFRIPNLSPEATAIASVIAVVYAIFGLAVLTASQMVD